MKINYRDVSHRKKEDSNPLKSSSSEEGEKNLEVSTTTIDIDNQEVSRAQSQKEILEKDDPLEKNEIDLSYASPKSGSGGERITTKSEGEEEAIAIQSPTEAIFETETAPVEKYLPKEKPEVVSPEKKKPQSFKKKVEKLSKTDLGGTRKAQGGAVPKKRKTPIFKSAPEQVIMSKGVAYLDGNTIKTTGGVKLHPGDEIKIGEKEFILKVGERKRKPLYLFIPIFLIVAVIILSQLLKGKSSGQLIGIILEEENRMVLPNAEIQIMELGKKVKPNQLGFFMFDSVPAGSYTLQTSSKGYQTVKDNITITKKQITTVSVLLPSKSLSELPDKSSVETPSKPEASEGEKTYGAIKIESNVSEPTVVMDDRMLGTGNKVYQNVNSGKHTVRIAKEGYRDWNQKIEVKPGKTLKLKIDLEEATAGSSSPQTPGGWITLAQDQMDSHDFASAVNSYTQALTLNPKTPEALLGRGSVYVQLNDQAKALEDLGKAAEYYTGEKNYNQAILCYTHLLALNDQDLKSFYNRGLCYLELDQYQKSAQDLKKTIELDKKFFSGYLYLGEAYLKSGDYEASLENYKKAKKLNPQSAQVYVGLAKVYFAKGEKSSAKKSYKKFEELSTYIDRERMKQDPEWRKVLEGIGEKAEPEF